MAITPKAPQAPPINYQRRELAKEFTAVWNRLQALYFDSVVGFHYITDHLQAEQAKARRFVSGSELDWKNSRTRGPSAIKASFPTNFARPGYIEQRRAR